MSTISQCVFCGFLENGHVAMRPCPGRAEHQFEPLSRKTIASALGSTGGRPPIYKNETDRRSARLGSFKRYNDKRRGKVTDPAA